jgi:polyisoprenoid-binding protein YceI
MGSTAEMPIGKRAGLRAWGLVILALGVPVMTTPPPVAAQVHGPIPNGRLASGRLSFDGHATVGDFTGKTTTMSGQISGAPDLSGVRGWVEAPVESLTTGDRRRDKDLNKSMESSRYPKLRFELSGITARARTADTIPVTLHGTFNIHGVTRPVVLPGVITFEGTTARVRSDFPMNLKDYHIGGLSKMLGMLKMHENIEVQVNLVFELGAVG